MKTCLKGALCALAITAAPSLASQSNLTAQVRQQAGLPGVQISHELTRAAQRQADYMARSGYVGHTGPRGRGILQRARSAGFNACRAAENVAMGFGSERQVIQAFLKSPKHRRNILNRHVRQVGIASARGRNGQTYWAMMLGTRC